MTNKEKFPTARQTRIALLVLLPLAILGGPHAVAWADLQLKTWTAKEPLKAADLNAEFAKIKAAVDDLQMRVGVTEQVGHVGSILVSGTCGFSVQLGSTSPFAFSTLVSGGGCKAEVVNVGGSSATLSFNGGNADVPAGSPLSFTLAGPPGHYEVVMTGSFHAFNGNTGGNDRAVVATRWHDGSTNSVSGFQINGNVGGDAPGTRYAFWGESSAGFTFPSTFSTTLSFQGANNAPTTKTSIGVQPTSDPAGPLEIRVYKR